MFNLFKKEIEINVTQIVNEIEAMVYAYVKPLGFRKYGRTLHRFVSEDISQVINFQSGLRDLHGLLCVNIGIRVPECEEMTFCSQEEKKKYYHEYDCTMRSRLGSVMGKKEKWYDLRMSTDKIRKDIIKQLDKVVLPAFDVLINREAILAHRKDYSWLLAYGSELLDECMIYGHLGNMEKAKELFSLYYESAVAEYNEQMTKGHKHYLKKGERVIYMGQDITAEKSGYVTLYGASRGHIDYLDELAIRLGLRENGGIAEKDGIPKIRAHF